MPTILIAEDEISLLNALAEKFKQAEFSVVTATDGELAWQAAQDKHPDYIVLDILMPKMNGFEVFGQIRQTTWGRNIPIMILSNISEEPRAIELAKSDPHCVYFTKSNLTIDDVITKVKNQLLSVNK
jgi:DNA-binding response OmpR family regulator